jgi:hypothetical protein
LIGEYLSVKKNATKAFLFIQSGKVDEDEAKEFAANNNLTLIYEDVEGDSDGTLKKDIKAYFRLQIAELRLKKD